MKKLLMFLAVCVSLNVFAEKYKIEFQAAGESEYHSGLIEDDLHFLTDAVSHYLSNEILCHSINVKFQVTEGSFFQDNSYSVQGTAVCPEITAGAMELNIEPSAGSEVNLKLKTKDQKTINKIFRMNGRGE